MNTGIPIQDFGIFGNPRQRLDFLRPHENFASKKNAFFYILYKVNREKIKIPLKNAEGVIFTMWGLA